MFVAIEKHYICIYHFSQNSKLIVALGEIVSIFKSVFRKVNPLPREVFIF